MGVKLESLHMSERDTGGGYGSALNTVVEERYHTTWVYFQSSTGRKNGGADNGGVGTVLWRAFRKRVVSNLHPVRHGVIELSKSSRQGVLYRVCITLGFCRTIQA
ncbi:unnamed protein product [Ectocarpus sp. 4 AP-2014]